jgi:hypothetical protein
MKHLRDQVDRFSRLVATHPCQIINARSNFSPCWRHPQVLQFLFLTYCQKWPELQTLVAHVRSAGVSSFVAIPHFGQVRFRAKREQLETC